MADNPLTPAPSNSPYPRPSEPPATGPGVPKGGPELPKGAPSMPSK